MRKLVRNLLEIKMLLDLLRHFQVQEHVPNWIVVAISTVDVKRYMNLVAALGGSSKPR